LMFARIVSRSVQAIRGGSAVMTQQTRGCSTASSSTTNAWVKSTPVGGASTSLDTSPYLQCTGLYLAMTTVGRQPATKPVLLQDLQFWPISLPKSTPTDGGSNNADSMVELEGEGNATSPMLAIKRQYQPSVVKRRRTHGFLARLETHGGRNILKRRRAKGRRVLTV